MDDLRSSCGAPQYTEGGPPNLAGRGRIPPRWEMPYYLLLEYDFFHYTYCNIIYFTWNMQKSCRLMPRPCFPLFVSRIRCCASPWARSYCWCRRRLP